MVGAVIAPSADPGSTAMPGSSVHRPLGAPDGIAGSEDAGAWSASSQSAAAWRALRHASSAVSPAIRAASASTVSRSSDPARLRADSCSFAAVAEAVRASWLMRLISRSQSRAAASTASRSVARPRLARNVRCASSLAARIVRGSAARVACSASSRCASYERCAARRVSWARSASARARDATSQRSSATVRSSPHGESGAARRGEQPVGPRRPPPLHAALRVPRSVGGRPLSVNGCGRSRTAVAAAVASPAGRSVSECVRLVSEPSSSIPSAAGAAHRDGDHPGRARRRRPGQRRQGPVP